MGLETAAIIGIASAGAAAVGGVASAVSSSSAARKNREMHSEALQFQQNMFEQQNEEYDRRFAKETEYNDPQKVMSRNFEAGINPIFGLGGSTTTSFGAPSPSVQSPPSPPQSPYTNLSGSGDLGSVLEKVGSFVSNVAGAFKDTAEGNKVANTTAGFVNNVELQNRLLAAQHYGKSLENLVAEKTSLKSALNNLAIQRSELQLNILKGFNIEEDTLLKQFQQFTEQCKQNMSQAEYARFVSMTPIILSNEKALLQVYRSQASMYSASADLSNAEAAKARQETKTEEWNTKIKEIEADLNDTTRANKLESLIAEYASQASKSRASDLYAKLEKQRLELVTAIKNKNWKKVDAVLNYMKSLSPDLISITGSVAK